MSIDTQDFKEIDSRQLKLDVKYLEYFATRKIWQYKDGSYHNALGAKVGYIQEEKGQYACAVKDLMTPFYTVCGWGTIEQAKTKLLPELLKEGYEL
jgi:hypothetical protein